MKTKQLATKLFILTVTLSVIFTGCSSKSSGSNDTTALADTAAAITEESSTASLSFEADEYYTAWQGDTYTEIKCSGTVAEVTGTGATSKSGVITIISAGTYVFSGTLESGQIYIEASGDDTVRLILNGLTLSCGNSAPIYAKKAKKVIISLEKDTQNTFTDSDTYTYSDAEAEEPNAAIFSKSDLIINGSGTLNVTALFNNGITSKDTLKIADGIINVTSADDSIMGRDAVLIENGTLTLNAEGDGIKTTNDTDASLGFISVTGGSFNITSGADGIQAQTALTASGGSFTIKTGGGSSNSSKSVGQSGNTWGSWQGGGMGRPGMSGENTTATTTTDTASAKALKASSDISITGGEFNIDSSDDSIHSNGNITISAGTFSLASGDDGIHADSAVKITGATIDITNSYEGIEGLTIDISGGDIKVLSSDDGLNAAGGADSSSISGRPGQNSFSSSSSSMITISGGNVYVEADGDGIDSNGSIIITDGLIIVNGPTNDGNGALDYGGFCQIDGGTLIAAGSSGMLQMPSTGTQAAFACSFASQAANTIISVTDSSANTVFAFAPAKMFNSIVYSSPQLTVGETYTLSAGSSISGSAVNGLYDGSASGGSVLCTISQSALVTNLVSASGGMGGQPGGGNMGGKNMWETPPTGNIPESDGVSGATPAIDTSVVPTGNAAGSAGGQTRGTFSGE